MKRLGILLALAGALICAALPAAAQNKTCPTMPLGDATNACASTAFVQQSFASGLPLPAGDVYVGNSSNLATAVPLTGDCAISISGVLTCAIPWAHVTGTPTTLAGYGITNARTQFTSSQTFFVNGNAAAASATTAAGDNILHFAVGSATTNGTTAAGNAILHFASTPTSIAVGATVTDATASVIPASTTVLSVTPTTVTLSANVIGGGVGSGDTIQFSFGTFLVGQTITDNTAGVIPPSTTITATSAATVTLSAIVTGGGVGNGDMIAASATCGTTGASTCAPGNDTNNGLSPAAPFLTAQHAVNLLIFNYDLAGFGAAIALAHGASSNYAFHCFMGPLIGQSVFSIQGDANAPTAVTIRAAPHTGDNGAIIVKDGCTAGINNVAFMDNATGQASNYINVGTGQYGHVDAAFVSFGALVNGTFVVANYGGSVTINFSNFITGGGNAAFSAGAGGVIEIGGTFAGSANLTFATGFALVQGGGAIISTQPLSSGSPTFTGFAAISGPRCFMSTLPSPDGVNPNSVFPGGTDCVVNFYVGALGVQSGTGASSTVNYGAPGQFLTSGGNGGGSPDTWDNLSAHLTAGPCIVLSGTTIVTISTAASCAITAGTTATSGITSGNFISSTANLVADSGKAVPTGAVVGTSDTQTLTGKSISGSTNTLTNIPNSALVNPSTTVAGQTCTLGSTCGLSTASNVLAADVPLNNTATYQPGPSMAQGTTGTWSAHGGVTATANNGDVIRCKLWDGTTVKDSTQVTFTGGGPELKISLSGIFVSPAGNIRIDCRNITSTTASKMAANDSANAADSTIYGERVQ
jgi:hypothetical protein